MRSFNPNQAYGKTFNKAEYTRVRTRKPKYDDGSPLTNVSWNSDVHCVFIPLFLPADIAHNLSNSQVGVEELVKLMLKHSTCTQSVEVFDSSKQELKIFRKP